MKISTIIAGILLLFSSAVFAEPHADAALTHAAEAVNHGKMGHSSVLVEHAETALTHAKQGVEVAKGESKTHMQEAVKSLESAIKHGKLDHADIATKAAEEACQHIKAGNK